MANHKHELMIFCRKCGVWVWHRVLDARWARCLGCGDLADLSEPATAVAEIATSGGREKRV